jgi:hypothetical protein
MSKLQEKPSALKTEHPALKKKLLPFSRIQGFGSVDIHFIRIQLFRLNTDPDPDPVGIQSLDDQKLK